MNSTLARVVSKCVLFGTTLPGPADGGEQDLLGGPPLVGRDDVLEREQLPDGLEEDVPGRRARVALVAALDRRPLVARHRARARVGEKVDENVGRVEGEEVVADTRGSLAARYSGVVSRSGSTEWIRKGSMIVLEHRRRHIRPDKAVIGVFPPVPQI